MDWKPTLIKVPDESGRTPLHYLADKKYNSGRSSISITTLLLEKDPSSGYCEDSEGSLPIHIAAANGFLRIVCQLIKMSPGCQLSCDASGQTILHVALKMKRYIVVRYICWNRSWSKMILNTQDKNGNTVLHLAVQQGSSCTFRILMERKEVFLSFRNRNGHTPLDLAVMGCRSELKLWPVCSINPSPLPSLTFCIFTHYLIYRIIKHASAISSLSHRSYKLL